MAIRYSKLWKRLIDENMMKVDLRDQAGITTNALAKLGKNEHGIRSRRGKGRKVIWLRRKQSKKY